ncbi:MAG TPA: PilZ domain-containing protein [Sphingobium sp.]
MFVENRTLQALQGGSDTDAFARPERTLADIDHPDRPTRVDLSEPARVRISTSLIRVRTIDISVAGAKLDLCAMMDCTSILSLFTPGTIVLLTITGMVDPRLCQVRWRSGSRIGVQFDTPITTDMLDCIVRHSGTGTRAACVLEVGTPRNNPA